MREDVWSHFGNWWAVALWAAFYAAFLLFLPYYRKAQRKPAGAFLAFVVAYALEMFGIPLSLYFVLWAFGASLPEGFLWGHSLVSLVGFAGTYACLACTLAGGALVAAGWRRIHRDYWSAEEGGGRLVREGPYAKIRHPQYAGFLVLSLGLLLEWANLPMLLLFPLICVLYFKLARREEAEMAERFGGEWIDYKESTGMFFPKLGRRAPRIASRDLPETASRRASGQAPAAAKAVVLLALASLALIAPSPSAAESAEAGGLRWRSYAEAGAGASFAGGELHPLAAFDWGLLLGDFELGAYLRALPLRFGSPDLVQEGAARWGASLGYKPELGLPLAPFARLGLGRAGIGRVPESGQGDLTDLESSIDCSFVLGAELPLGGRWAARAWAAWDLSPGLEDYRGASLSGPSAGLSIRATWETTIR
ncbi:MAG TPA: isoprenylcysteine carboxylmethyltransferase family protein [Spirochaetales bacterium]|nr:isoprenylcysteine carboxylmethyltransferase family protein [Spirochaetales bacterium]HRY53266.1 isoprenylcysteine carboxylmethyltransferase family protein [Spirochaetia bacterium]HRZ64491.1 isoprenylcysteine carboxylmethyltransferase family protein [Spirochaetia bacterium]